MNRTACLAILLAFGATTTEAQTWPTRPIEMIIPYTAGGGTDVIGRSMAAAMSEQFGQQVAVINRDGAGGTLGFNTLATSAPDGYTIAFSPTTPITNAPYLVKGVRYQADSFDYICQVFENVFSITVAPESKLKSAKDLFAVAAENPGKLTYGHAGSGTIPHLAVENLADALKLKFQAVPFRGDGALLPVLLKGDLDFAAPAVSSIRGQNLRTLLVFSDQRHPALPDAPTARELGVAASVPPGFNGMYAPKGLPAEVRARLEQGCASAVKSEVVLRATDNTGQTISYLTGAEFSARTEADYKLKGELIRRLGLAGQ